MVKLPDYINVIKSFILTSNSKQRTEKLKSTEKLKTGKLKTKMQKQEKPKQRRMVT